MSKELAVQTQRLEFDSQQTHQSGGASGAPVLGDRGSLETHGQPVYCK